MTGFRSMMFAAALIGAGIAGGSASAAPVPAGTADIATAAPLETVQWGPGYYGPRRHFGPRYGYYGPPRRHWRHRYHGPRRGYYGPRRGFYGPRY